MALTRGTPLSWTNLLASVHSADHVFTGVHEPDEDTISWVGQIHQSPKLSSAQIHFVLPPKEDVSQDLIPLLEGLIVEAGHWGAKQIFLDLALDSDLFSQFRKAGFSVLAKHRVYKFDALQVPASDLSGRWRLWTSEDIPAMRALYSMLVPPLIRSVEPVTRLEMLGLVYDDGSGDLQAYADMVYGPVGVWVLPFIHPQAVENTADLLTQLVNSLPDLVGRPVYLTARSYQPWIENALDTLPVEIGQEQALMVRYLAIRQRVRTELPFATLENGNPEPTVPLAPIKRHRG